MRIRLYRDAASPTSLLTMNGSLYGAHPELRFSSSAMFSRSAIRAVGTPVLAQASTDCAWSWNNAILMVFLSGGKRDSDAGRAIASTQAYALRFLSATRAR